jgi:hypothetical protein
MAGDEFRASSEQSFDPAGLDLVELLAKALRLNQQVADLLLDPVGGLVGHPGLAKKFLAAYAIACIAEQIHMLSFAAQEFELSAGR